MATKLMFPPDDGSRNAVAVNGRAYSSTPGVGINAPSFDAAILEANGWYRETISSGGGSSDMISNPVSTLTRSATGWSNVTTPVASPGVVNWTNHGFVAGNSVSFDGAGLPTGITSGNTYYVIAAGLTASAFQISATKGGAAINFTGTSSGSQSGSPVYTPLSLIGNSTATGSLIVPSFNILDNSSGGIISRIRVHTNAPNGFGGISLQIGLWLAAPTYSNGDLGSYAPATGSTNWLGTYSTNLVQFTDGAVGIATPSVGNPPSLKLASGTTIYWDLQILSTAWPFTNQTFTITPEILN